jgi:hypothetical protein
MALCFPLIVAAQERPSRPSDEPVAPTTLPYRSAFSDYRPWQEVKPGDWRALNDTVREAAARGGAHGGHSMGQQPAGGAGAPTPSKPPASDKPDQGGHGGSGGPDASGGHGGSGGRGGKR